MAEQENVGISSFCFSLFPLFTFTHYFLSFPLFISFWLILCFGIRARYCSGSGLTPNKRRRRTFEERIRQCSLYIYMMSPLAAAHRLVKTTSVTGPKLRHVCIYVILCCKGIFTCKTVSSGQVEEEKDRIGSQAWPIFPPTTNSNSKIVWSLGEGEQYI